MRDVEFQFQNGLIYAGKSGGKPLLGNEVVFITEKMRRAILKDISTGAGTRRVADPAAIIRKISGARKISSTGLIPLWGLPITVLKDLHVLEISAAPEKDEGGESSREFSLNSHYFDVVRHWPNQMSVGEMKDLEDGKTVTYWGEFRSLDRALQRIQELGASERSSVHAGKADADILEDRVIARKYMSQFRMVKDVSDEVSEIPIEVLKAPKDYQESWAKQVLFDARKNHPDVEWYMGITPIMVEIENFKSKMVDPVEG